jgi:MoxR-like ATPase
MSKTSSAKGTGQAPAGRSAAVGPTRVLDAPDRRDGRVYVMSRDIDLAVRVALATGRPLLLRGEPGSGKSSLAAHIARKRRWRYYEHVVTSRTQARDLLWTFDSVRRLADAEVRRSGADLNDYDYVEPGVLWWAFAHESALRRGAPDGMAPTADAVEQNAEINATRSADHAVVLIDEIDKADPDMPNGLLVPLGSNEFIVSETNTVIRSATLGKSADPSISRHIIVITTNEERTLPQAFLRRCVTVWLPQPDKVRLVAIARAHMRTYEGEFSAADAALARAIAAELDAVRDEARQRALRPPSTAEFLDALRACRALNISVGSEDWKNLRSLTLVKPQQPE